MVNPSWGNNWASNSLAHRNEELAIQRISQVSPSKGVGQEYGDSGILMIQAQNRLNRGREASSPEEITTGTISEKLFQEDIKSTSYLK